MLRRVLTILSLIGLLLSVGLWAGSYFLSAVCIRPGPWDIFWLDKGCIGKSVVLTLDAGDSTLTTSPGGVTTMEATNIRVQISASEWIDAPWTEFPRMAPPTFRWKYTGFKGLDTRWMPSLSFGRLQFVVPLWMPLVAFAAFTWWLCVVPVYRRRKRKKLGLCMKCGYDLRASKERCPECGESFEKP